MLVSRTSDGPCRSGSLRIQLGTQICLKRRALSSSRPSSISRACMHAPLLASLCPRVSATPQFRATSVSTILLGQCRQALRLSLHGIQPPFSRTRHASRTFKLGCTRSTTEAVPSLALRRRGRYRPRSTTRRRLRMRPRWRARAPLLGMSLPGLMPCARMRRSRGGTKASRWGRIRGRDKMMSTAVRSAVAPHLAATASCSGPPPPKLAGFAAHTRLATSCYVRVAMSTVAAMLTAVSSTGRHRDLTLGTQARGGHKILP